MGRPETLHTRVTFSPSSAITEEGFFVIKAATENNRHKKKITNQKTLNPSSRNFLYYNLVDHHDFKYVAYFLYSAFVCSRSKATAPLRSQAYG